MTNWAQIVKGLLFYAYVEIHQVRLVYDDYQCVFKLTSYKKIVMERNILQNYYI